MPLEVKNLTRVFVVGLFKRKEILAVDGVSFGVKPGEFVSLVGESGSGKTTTAKMILRLLQPTSGSIMFEGRDVWGLKGIDELRWYWKNVHGIFQDPYASYNPLHKIDRILYQAFTLMRHSGADRDVMVEEALREVGLRPDDVLGKYPHELSGGQRQRIMVARCYLLRPKLILADEPISMIDASTRASVLQLFSKLREEFETSVIFITHDLGLAYYVSDEIMIMYKGSIVEKGSPDEVIDHPQDSYTKRLREDVPLLYRKWAGF
ncbi:MAG: dipeptide/oligopeptide/nickel ABC transporter ATP-binding protein [Candidatus Bathyarchaeota archaeon]|nr:dipeptide/oligopeptide/nickel ABC transporter ATP-binding protein [Candidatus Bathyarchaeota archaeon]MDH5688685.1 dipeptide/oligopeptide/nickel ABC transporter ATP-binding protein [Candidatus Bathyarchaeota archaeon]